MIRTRCTCASGGPPSEGRWRIRRAGVLACRGACRSGTVCGDSMRGVGSGIRLAAFPPPAPAPADGARCFRAAAGVGMRVRGLKTRAFSSFSSASRLLGGPRGFACAPCRANEVMWPQQMAQPEQA